LIDRAMKKMYRFLQNTKRLRSISVKFLALFISYALLSPIVLRPCTIAVVSGSVTLDGRPLLWKNRDVTDQDNVVRYFYGGRYPFIGITQAGDHERVYAGINTEGFAILNSVSYDLEGDGDTDHGRFMKRALEECVSVEDFEMLLIETNGGRRKTQANFGVIDALGNAAIFETANTSYTRFDASHAPDGFVVRTNFAMTGVKEEMGGGYERFVRANELFEEGATSKILSHEYILVKVARDLENESIDPYPLPFEGSQNGHTRGYIHTNYSINRFRTASSLVIHGVLLVEDPGLSTMWCIMGEPVCGIAIPLWVHARSVPYVMEGNYTSPMRDAVKLKESQCYSDPLSDRYINTYELVYESGKGILPYVRTLENEIFKKTEKTLQTWRQSFPSSSDIKNFQEDQTFWAYMRYSKQKSGYTIR